MKNVVTELCLLNSVLEKIILFIINSVERKSAFECMGFSKSEEFLIGTMDGYSYKDYWIREKL